jgi:hypothetical protein
MAPMTSLPSEFTVNFGFRSPPCRTRTAPAPSGTSPRIDANAYFAGANAVVAAPFCRLTAQPAARLSALTPRAVINDKENI